MKKLSFGAVIVILIAIIIANRDGDKVAQDVSPTPSPSTFIVVVVAPDVMVKNPSDATFKTITAQAEIMAGTEIKTSAAGKAKLLYPNGTITNIDVDSHIKVEALNGKGEQSRISIVFGGVWSKIKNVLGADEYYEVETDNTVASVRGTIFWTEFRNKVTKITGIESKVRVRARDPKTKKVIEGSDVEVTTGEETNINSDTLPKEQQRLTKRVLAATDLQEKRIKDRVLDYVEKEDLDKDQVRGLIKKVRDNNINDRPFIQKMIERRLLDQDGTPLPTRSPSVSPKPTLTPRVSPTPEPTAKPTVTPEATAVPTPVTISNPTLESVYPASIKAGEQIALNGKNFTSSNGTRKFSKVLIGAQQVTPTYVDGLTIYTKTDSLLAGVHNVSIITVEGETLTLTEALTIQ